MINYEFYRFKHEILLNYLKHQVEKDPELKQKEFYVDIIIDLVIIQLLINYGLDLRGNINEEK